MNDKRTIEQFLMLLSLAATFVVGHPASVFSQEKPLSRILFGSCVKQDRPMPIFEKIADERPDLFIFLGDNIYADTTDMDVMREKYAKLKADAGFARLLRTCPVMATWDDHDYGANDAYGANTISCTDRPCMKNRATRPASLSVSFREISAPITCGYHSPPASSRSGFDQPAGLARSVAKLM